MTAEVQAACVAEGLTLARAGNSGYMGVYSNSKGFEVKHNRDYLGFFDTALEAALVYARRAEGGGGAQRPRLPTG